MQTNRKPITPDGARRLREELDSLWRVTRPELTRRVAAAAALGDRSENADYIYNKKHLREVDRRIRYLSKTLERLQVVDRLPADTSRVFFGAWFRLRDERDEEQVLRIVGADEIDPRRGWISIDSPMARCLLKHQAGDRIFLQLGEVRREFDLLEVSYTPLAQG